MNFLLQIKIIPYLLYMIPILLQPFIYLPFSLASRAEPCYTPLGQNSEVKPLSNAKRNKLKKLQSNIPAGVHSVS